MNHTHGKRSGSFDGGKAKVEEPQVTAYNQTSRYSHLRPGEAGVGTHVCVGLRADAPVWWAVSSRRRRRRSRAGSIPPQCSVRVAATWELLRGDQQEGKCSSQF